MHNEVITNTGVRSFGQELEEQMYTCDSFEIATAFITEDALHLIEIFLTKNKNRNRTGKLITGFYHCFNSQKVLMRLQILADKSKGTFKVSMSRNQRFHWKYYGFELKGKNIVYIGSANFTKSGISSPGEIITKQTMLRADQSQYKKYTSTFGKEWENSVPISKIPLEKYKQNPSSSNKTAALSKEIRNLLVKPKLSESSKASNGIVRVILLNDYLSRATEKIISNQKSHWDRQNYDLLCYSNKADFNAILNSPNLVVIEKYNGVYKIGIARIMDNDILNTPDGNYFIAYKYKTKLKVETMRLRNALEGMGLNYHVRRFRDKSLGSRQSAELLKLLS